MLALRLFKSIQSSVLLYFILSAIVVHGFLAVKGGSDRSGWDEQKSTDPSASDRPILEEKLEVIIPPSLSVLSAIISSDASPSADSVIFNIGDLVMFTEGLSTALITNKSIYGNRYKLLTTDSEELLVSEDEIELIEKSSALHAPIKGAPSKAKEECRILPGMLVHLVGAEEKSKPETYHVIQVVDGERKAFIQSTKNLGILCFPIVLLDNAEQEVPLVVNEAINSETSSSSSSPAAAAPAGKSSSEDEDDYEIVTILAANQASSSSSPSPSASAAISSFFSLFSVNDDKNGRASKRSRSNPPHSEAEFAIPDLISMHWIKSRLIPHLLGDGLTGKTIKTILEVYRPMAMMDAKLNKKGVVKRLYLQSHETVTVVGDVHGQLGAILSVFGKNGYPSESNKYIFNGDMVDRGMKSIECVLLLYALKIAVPNGIYINLGNHETRTVKPQKFATQCRLLDIRSGRDFIKLSDETYSRITEDTIFADFHRSFTLMNYVTIIQDKIFVTHGGLCEEMTLADLESINSSEVLTPRIQHFLYSLLWNDPSEEPGMHGSNRGHTVRKFGPDITKAFLEKSNLRVLVRSHEFCQTGLECGQSGQCMTIFSAPNYCGVAKNTGAYAKFDDKMKASVMFFE